MSDRMWLDYALDVLIKGDSQERIPPEPPTIEDWEASLEKLKKEPIPYRAPEMPALGPEMAKAYEQLLQRIAAEKNR